MKYCIGCGSKLEDGVKFCTVCGQPVESAETAAVETAVKKEKKVRKKFPAWIVIAVLAVVVLAAATFFAVKSGMFLSPDKQFVALHKEAVVNPTIEAASLTLSGKASEKAEEELGINTDVEITVEQDIDEDVQEQYLDDSSVTLQINTVEEEKLFGFELNLMGSDVLSGVVVIGEDFIGIQLPELDDEYYTIDFDDLAALLSQYAGVDEEQAKQVLAVLSGEAASFDIDAEKVEAVAGKYAEIFFSMVTKDNVTREKKDLSLEGIGKKQKGCTVLTFKPTDKDIEKMLTTAAETFVDDDDLADIVEEILDTLGDSAGYTMKDYEKLVDYVDENYEDDIEDIVEKIDDLDLYWSAAIKGTRIYEIKVYSEEEENGFSYESFGELTDSRIDAFIVYDEGDAEVVIQNSLKLKGKSVTGELEGNKEYFSNEDFSVSYTFDLTEKSGLKFPYCEVEGEIGDVRFELNVGKNGKTGSLHELVVKSNGQKIQITAVSTDEESSAAAPKGKGTSVTVDNFQEIVQGMAMEAMQIFSEIFG